MNELHAAANAYYNNGSTRQRDLVLQFFKAMDVDGNGRVSRKEFTDFLCRTSARFHPQMFDELDINGDGELDMSEVLTLYYVAKTRTVGCDTCRQFLNGLYFTCVTCYDKTDGDTFDLCVKCYRGRNYSHSHSLFLDTYVLLVSKRYPQYLERTFKDQDLAPQQPLQQSSSKKIEEEEEEEGEGEQEKEKKIGWRDVAHAYHAMEIGWTIGSVGAAAACTIM